MTVDYNALPDHSRAWIYQCDRNLNEEEISVLTSELKRFTAQWQAHGKDLNAGFSFFYNRFLIIAVDEGPQNATGCSIDGSVRILQSLGSKLGFDFFDRMSILYKNGDEVRTTTMKGFKELLASGKCDQDTVVFNNTLTDLGAVRKSWEGPAKQSWHSRFLPVKT